MAIDLTALQQISIPYGAIKSIYHLVNPAKWEQFQFLMVRLKVFKKHNMPIPKKSFQFLMVRLKGVLTTSTTSKNLTFQFLMVRLKACIFR